MKYLSGRVQSSPETSPKSLTQSLESFCCSGFPCTARSSQNSSGAELPPRGTSPCQLQSRRDSPRAVSLLPQLVGSVCVHPAFILHGQGTGVRAPSSDNCLVLTEVQSHHYGSMSSGAGHNTCTATAASFNTSAATWRRKHGLLSP